MRTTSFSTALSVGLDVPPSRRVILARSLQYTRYFLCVCIFLPQVSFTWKSSYHNSQQNKYQRKVREQCQKNFFFFFSLTFWSWFLKSSGDSEPTISPIYSPQYIHLAFFSSTMGMKRVRQCAWIGRALCEGPRPRLLVAWFSLLADWYPYCVWKKQESRKQITKLFASILDSKTLRLNRQDVTVY